MDALAHVRGILAFGLSGVLSVLPAWWIASRLTPHARERYWILTAVVSLELGILSQLLSAARLLSGGPWLAGQLLFAVSCWGGCALICPRNEAQRSPASRLRAADGFLLALFLSGIAISALRQWRSPVQTTDDVMYHGPRVLLWLQHHSMAPYTTNNDRQIVFPHGAEVFALWPLLLDKWERLARMAVWTAFPAAGVGVYVLSRQLGASRPWATGAAAAFVWTPMALDQAISLKPELWSTVFLLGTAFWLVRTLQSGGSDPAPLFWLGAYASLSANAKLTLVTVPIIVAAWILVRVARTGRGLSAIPLVVGLATGLLLSGLAQVLINNQSIYGHPMGPAPMRQVHEADVSPVQAAEHVARFALLLVDLPAVPARVSTAIGGGGRLLLAATGLDRPLPMEEDEIWPGPFRYAPGPHAVRFSSVGLLWLPCLTLVALLRLRRPSEAPLRGVAAVALVSGIVAAAILVTIRWQATAGVPDRFMTPPYALGVVVVTWVLESWARNHRTVFLAAAAALVWTVTPLLPAQLHRAMSITPSGDTRAYYRIADAVPAGSRIIHMGGSAAQEYFLFGPRHGFSNEVFPWGTVPFDPARMSRLISETHATHIVVEDEEAISFHWWGLIDSRPAVAWLQRQPQIREIALEGLGRTRVFAVGQRSESLPQPAGRP